MKQVKLILILNTLLLIGCESNTLTCPSHFKTRDKKDAPWNVHAIEEIENKTYYSSDNNPFPCS